MVAEQKALETARLQDILDTYKKENDELKIEVKTLKCVFFSIGFDIYVTYTEQGSSHALCK